MIERKQYRACLRTGWKAETLEQAIREAAEAARAAVEAGSTNDEVGGAGDQGMLLWTLQDVQNVLELTTYMLFTDVPKKKCPQESLQSLTTNTFPSRKLPWNF